MEIEEDEVPGIPEWVVTFGDMMSLLLTFFIMLVSMSEIKKEEVYEAVVESMRQRFGHSMARLNVTPGNALPRSAKKQKNSTTGRAKKMDTHSGGAKVLAPTGDNLRVTILRDAKGAVIGGVVYFKAADDVLSEDAKESLTLIASQVLGKPQKVEVRGHTSRIPLPANSAYADHWTLAFERALKVKDFLVSKKVDPRRIRISDASAYEPVYLGTSPVDLHKNDRVEVLVLKETIEDFEGTPSERAGRLTDGPER